MSDFHTLTVKHIHKETPNSVVISLTVPGNLMRDYSFKAGQYLTLETTIQGVKVRRAYSICSAPHESTLKVGVKKVEGGVFSTYANETLAEGDTLDVMIPQGKFILSPNKENKHAYAAFAAGSGITPILSIIKTVLTDEPHSTFTLVYGNQSPTEAMFRDELIALQKTHGDRLQIIWMYSRDTNHGTRNGRIDSAVVNEVVATNTYSSFYLCGPETMIKEVSSALTNKGISEAAIHFELFTASTEEDAVIDTFNGTTQITVLLDDDETSFTMNATDAILDATLAQKIDAPYSCQGGICSSCIARITEGKAEMRQNQILTDGEVAEGLVLTCQAHPTTAKVVVDYDDV